MHIKTSTRTNGDVTTMAPHCSASSPPTRSSINAASRSARPPTRGHRHRPGGGPAAPVSGDAGERRRGRDPESVHCELRRDGAAFRPGGETGCRGTGWPGATGCCSCSATKSSCGSLSFTRCGGPPTTNRCTRRIGYRAGTPGRRRSPIPTSEPCCPPSTRRART